MLMWLAGKKSQGSEIGPILCHKWETLQKGEMLPLFFIWKLIKALINHNNRGFGVMRGKDKSEMVK